MYLFQSKLLENHTLHSNTYLYNPYMAATPPSDPRGIFSFSSWPSYVRQSSSRLKENFACGIWDRGNHFLCNLESWTLVSRIQLKETEIHNVEST